MADRDCRARSLVARAAWKDDPPYPDAYLQQIPEVIRDRRPGRSSPLPTISPSIVEALQWAARHFLFAHARRVGTPQLAEEQAQYPTLLRLLTALQSFLDTWDLSARSAFADRVVGTGRLPWRSRSHAIALRKEITTFDELVQRLAIAVEGVVQDLPRPQMGRPIVMEGVHDFIIELADIYERLTERKAGLSRDRKGAYTGPFLRFVAHCLTPFASDLGIKSDASTTADDLAQSAFARPTADALAQRRRHPSSPL